MKTLQLFGTDGIRGKAFEFPISLDVMRHIGYFIARQALQKNKAVAICKDTRASGSAIQEALLEGIHAAAFDEVHLLGILPTAACARYAYEHSCFGIMITASHNPASDNGVKIFNFLGDKLSFDEQIALEEYVLANYKNRLENVIPVGPDFRQDDSIVAGNDNYLRGSKEIQTISSQWYVDTCLKSFANLNLQGIKIVLDAGNGAAYYVAERIFSLLNAELIVRGNSPNGNNINVDSGAMYPDALAQAVRQNGAHIGFAYDGDADRLVVVDEAAHVIRGDFVLAYIGEWICRTKNLTKLVATKMSNMGLDEHLLSLGIDVLRCDIGDQSVIAEMKKSNLFFGGEESGHFIFNNPIAMVDAIVSSLYVLEALQENGHPASVMHQRFSLWPQVKKDIRVDKKIPFDSIPNLLQAIQEIERELGATGRVLVRYSGTENKVRLLLEGKETSQLDAMLERLSSYFH